MVFILTHSIMSPYRDGDYTPQKMSTQTLLLKYIFAAQIANIEDLPFSMTQ